MTEKLKEVIGPIFKDGQSALLYIGGLATVIFLIIAIIKLKGAQEQNERKPIILWMRIIVAAYIGLNLVAWFVMDYLQPAVTGNGTKKTTQIEQTGDKIHWIDVV